MYGNHSLSLTVVFMYREIFLFSPSQKYFNTFLIFAKGDLVIFTPPSQNYMFKVIKTHYLKFVKIMNFFLTFPRFWKCGLNRTQLNSSSYLSHEIVHPQHQVPDHSEEPEQVSGIVQLPLPGVSESLELHPGPDHLPLSVGDLHSLFPGISSLQLGRVLLDRCYLHLHKKNGKVLTRNFGKYSWKFKPTFDMNMPNIFKIEILIQGVYENVN